MSFLSTIFIYFFIFLNQQICADDESKSVLQNKMYCKRNDACLEYIATDITSKAMSPTQGIVDPLFLDTVDANLLAFNYKLFNATVTGLNNCKSNILRASIKDLILVLDYQCSNVKGAGDYETHGKLFDWNVQGKGDFNIVLGKFVTTAVVNLNEVRGKDGKLYFKIQTYKTNATVLSPFRIQINNLFPEQKGLSEAFHKFMHTNWKPVAEFLQGPLLDTTWKKLLGFANKVLKTNPIEN